MNLIEPLSQEVVSRDMPPSVTASLTIFLGAVLGGFYFFDWLQRWKKTEEKIQEIEQRLHETTSMVEAQADTIHEHEQRIREKQDYDETDETEEGKYQAWRGEYHQEYRKVEIHLWREKLTKIKENQGWVAWAGQKDGSTTVRDFYLGNEHPEFQWDVEECAYFYTTKVSETFVENWDNVIRLDITMTFVSKQDVMDFLDTSEFWPNLTMNLALKKVLESKDLSWKRVLNTIT